jgi:mono/diheme cytochrome c family protein
VRGVFMLLLSAIAVLCFFPMRAAQGPTNQTSRASNAHSGKTIFLQKCFQCHSVIEGQARLGPNLYGVMKKPHPRKTDSDVNALLKNGKGKMPSFADTLTPEDEGDLIAYLHSI